MSRLSFAFALIVVAVASPFVLPAVCLYHYLWRRND
jgi:hypothetical protein